MLPARCERLIVVNMEALATTLAAPVANLPLFLDPSSNLRRAIAFRFAGFSPDPVLMRMGSPFAFVIIPPLFVISVVIARMPLSPSGLVFCMVVAPALLICGIASLAPSLQAVRAVAVFGKGRSRQILQASLTLSRRSLRVAQNRHPSRASAFRAHTARRGGRPPLSLSFAARRGCAISLVAMIVSYGRLLVRAGVEVATSHRPDSVLTRQHE